MKKQIKWTVEQVTVLYEHYEDHGASFCAEVLNAMGFERSVRAVSQYARLCGLTIKNNPRGRFKKGHIPASKGKKLTVELYQKLSSTMFKKGQQPKNSLPIGAEILRADQYWWVKVAQPNKWVQKHRLLYENEIGPVPAGHLIVFRDGDPHNFHLDNLEAITRKEQVRRNRWGSGPSEFSLKTGRAAAVRLNKKGFSDRIIRENPELLELAKAETLLKLEIRKSHATRT